MACSRTAGYTPALLGVALVAVALALGLMVGGVFSSKHEIVAAPPVTASVPAAADASVFAASPDTNHGASRRLRVDDSRVMRTYLRFDLSQFTGHVTSAELVLDPLIASPAVDLAPGGWSEDQITYANAPRPGSRVGLTGPLQGESHQ